MRLFVSHKPAAARSAKGQPPKPVPSVKKEDLAKAQAQPPGGVEEIGGPEGPEPTRYGDWERKGIASDF